MIRVLYVVDSLMAGGIESQLVELATGLDQTRFAPVFLCLYGPGVRDLHFAPRLRAASIPLYLSDLGWGGWDKVKGVAGIVSTARTIRPHIIQAEGYHANLLTRLAFPLLPKTVLIGSVRGLHTTKQLFYERISHWTCAQMVVNAPHLQTMLETQAHVPSAKICSIPNGIALERFARPHDPMLRQRIAPDARRVIVSLGRISFEKNMHWLVEGMGLLKRQQRLPADVRLFIVGPIQDAAAQQALDDAIQRDALGQQVVQHAATMHPEDYYHACDACALYSPAEGLPNVAIETLASGRPMLISQAANSAGVIEHGVTGWVARTQDRADLADTLAHIFSLPDSKLTQMRAACLQRARAYRVEALTERYMTLYEKYHPAARAS